MLELLQHERSVLSLLKMSNFRGMAQIMTCASKEWVESTCSQHMPSVWRFIQHKNIEVVCLSVDNDEAEKSKISAFVSAVMDTGSDNIPFLSVRVAGRGESAVLLPHISICTVQFQASSALQDLTSQVENLRAGLTRYLMGSTLSKRPSDPIQSNKRTLETRLDMIVSVQ